MKNSRLKVDVYTLVGKLIYSGLLYLSALYYSINIWSVLEGNQHSASITVQSRNNRSSITLNLEAPNQRMQPASPWAIRTTIFTTLSYINQPQLPWGCINNAPSNMHARQVIFLANYPICTQNLRHSWHFRLTPNDKFRSTAEILFQKGNIYINIHERRKHLPSGINSGVLNFNFCVGLRQRI